jgi:glycosyltransferase involved in cell wall biosynthesis
MKLLCICSALDLRYRYGCTPAWWQFLKGFYELGHEVIAIPYQGAAIETPWWRAYPNPCQFEGEAFQKVKRLFGSGATSTQEGFAGAVTKGLIDSWIRPRWESHLRDILRTEHGIDAVIFFGAPLNHFTGVPARLKEQFRVPFFFFDGDTPASLPRFQGFSTGFRIYEGADLTEYDGFLCNSEGSVDELRRMGARRAGVVHWGVDPSLYEPLPVEPDRDVFFYGFGVEYREELIDAMLVKPSEEMPEASFAVGGGGFPSGMGQVRVIGDVPFAQFRRECGRSRINLSITRSSHASVHASSTMRPFELAAMGCCIVSGPHDGIETWFEVGAELLVVHSAEEAVTVYRALLAGPAERARMGESARRRVLEHHTHRHRAEQIAQFIRGD